MRKGGWFQNTTTYNRRKKKKTQTNKTEWNNRLKKGVQISKKQSYREVALILTDATFVSVDVAGAAYVASGAVTVEHAVDGVGVTLRALSAGVTDTGIVYVA